MVVLRGSTRRAGCLGVLVVNMSGKTPRACWEPGRGAAWLGGDQGWRRPDSGLGCTRHGDVSEVVAVLAAVGRRRRWHPGFRRPRAGGAGSGQVEGPGPRSAGRGLGRPGRVAVRWLWAAAVNPREAGTSKPDRALRRAQRSEAARVGLAGGAGTRGTKVPARHRLLAEQSLAGPTLAAGAHPAGLAARSPGARPRRRCRWCRAQRSRATRSGERGSGRRALGVLAALAASRGRAGPAHGHLDRVPFQGSLPLPFSCLEPPPESPGPTQRSTLGLDAVPGFPASRCHRPARTPPVSNGNDGREAGEAGVRLLTPSKRWAR